MRRPQSTRVAHGRLGPAELAEAVVLADVSLALTILGQVIPLGSALLVAAVVPLAVVAARHRLRAVITGTVAASVVGFLVIGSAAFTSMGACAALGALVGAADRRGWTRRRTMVVGLAVMWPIDGRARRPHAARVRATSGASRSIRCATDGRGSSTCCATSGSCASPGPASTCSRGSCATGG